MFTDFSLQSVGTGLLVAIVGYVSSVTVVIHGLAAVGASENQIISALLALGLSQCAAALILCLASRMPLSIAWSTPGMALLATLPALEGGFPVAVGSFILVGVFTILAGLSTHLGRLVAMIPKPIANAMLAGILLKLCLAPFAALSEAPRIGLVLIGTWLIVGRFTKLWATPAALVVAVVAFVAGSNPTPFSISPPHLEWVVPAFTWAAAVSIALPLFVVTMASQNIPGLTVLATFDYRPAIRPVFLVTGGLSALTALFGAPTINLAAITAALCAGPDAHLDPKRRYVAAVVAGLFYGVLGVLASITTLVVVHSSPALIEGVAGLALIPAFGSATFNAVREERDRIPALTTFLITASGLAVYGIGSAFWGLMGGLFVHAMYARRLDA